MSRHLFGTAPTRPGRWACRYSYQPAEAATVYDVVQTTDGLRAIIRGHLCECPPSRELTWSYVGPIVAPETLLETPADGRR